MQAANLKTCGRTNPLGIDDRAPFFRWTCQGGKTQTAYQLIAKSEGGELLWDSGKIKTSRMGCTYQGPALKSGQRVTWTVTLWDENGVPEESEAAWFEMGLLSPEDWRASWICGADTDRVERLPADLYKKEFSVHGELRSARLYATACGVYAAVFNGQRLPGVLAPGSTEYEKRLHYQTYDITDLVKERSTLEIAVGDGWFKGKVGSSNYECFFGSQLKLLAQVVLRYADGTEEIIGTDESWLWCNDGPILYADLKDGEVYDARRVPSYGGHAQKTDYPVIPTASPAGMILEHERFPAKLLISPSGAKLLDFGQNLAGYVRFAVKGREGQTIRLRLTEVLDHGEFTDITLRQTQPGRPGIKQEIVYTCKEGDNVFRPEFFYSGFRYALVEGLDEVDPACFEAVAVYSDLTFTGFFRCSNGKLNQFFQNTVWGMKSNFVDVPTDCPQREKSGWTGDAQVFAKTASYLADTAPFYRKWLRDVGDCQREDGRVENVCPKVRGVDERDVLNGAVGWGDAAVIIPYTLWKRYGDDRIIEENYPLLHGWKEYMIHAAADKSYDSLPDGHPLKSALKPSPLRKYVIESGLHWGEWCEPGVDGGKELVRPKQELTAAYMHYSMGLLAEMLRSVGRDEEAAQCEEYSEGAKKAYNFYFVRDGHIQAPRQAPMVRALALGLLDDETAKSVAADLNDDAVQRSYTVGTGFLSTPFVLSVLAKYGYVDTAYRMLENTAAPGWLAMVEQGATTVWENYQAYDGEGRPLLQSMNHYSPGAVCAFLFEAVCGIQVSGENRFRIAPIPGGTLTRAEAVYDSPYGRVSCGWERENGAVCYHVSVPANTAAELLLPGRKAVELESGEHEGIF